MSYGRTCFSCGADVGREAHNYPMNVDIVVCSFCGKANLSSGGTDGFRWIDPGGAAMCFSVMAELGGAKRKDADAHADAVVAAIRVGLLNV